MTYQEAKWIVKEVERLISAYKRNIYNLSASYK